jgi:hypothetical protein
MATSKVLALALAVAAMLPASAGGQTAKEIGEEWRLLREELRRQGLPVASYVGTPEQVAADIARVRRELVRRDGRTPVSSMQRVGGGSPNPAARQKADRKRTGLHPTPRLSTHSLR